MLKVPLFWFSGPSFSISSFSEGALVFMVPRSCPWPAPLSAPHMLPGEPIHWVATIATCVPRTCEPVSSLGLSHEHETCISKCPLVLYSDALQAQHVRHGAQDLPANPAPMPETCDRSPLAPLSLLLFSLHQSLGPARSTSQISLKLAPLLLFVNTTALVQASSISCLDYRPSPYWSPSF